MGIIMLGVLVYIFFLFMGFLYADVLFRKKDMFFRIWMGGVFGNVILMVGIVPFAFLFKFSILSHILLIIAAVLPYIFLNMKNKNKLSADFQGEKCISNKVFVFFILPITAVIWILMTNHILAPYDGGGVASGQCTYGDLQMHLSFVTSIAEQQTFPPNYCQLSGTALNYPFFADMLSSSLYLFGTPLRWALLVPSYVFALLIVMGFYITAHKITGRKSAAILATVLFFLNGGFGFAYFIDGARADVSIFGRIFSEYYKTPTNYVDKNIRWVNTICDMIIPQRTTMAGWCVILPSLWMLSEAKKENNARLFVVLGVLAGCMPMIHTHSFLALGIISAVMMTADLFESKSVSNLKNWLLYGGIACIMALPQLCFWTFRQTAGNESFLRFCFDWANEKDTYFWFYLKNWGIVAIFLIPALFNASKENKTLALGGAFIMLLAEFIVFQPNVYDNNKLLFVVYMIAVMLVSGFLTDLYDKLCGIKCRAFMAVTVVAAGTLSGVLTIGREYLSGAQYMTYSENDIEFAEFLKENTEPQAVFLTGTQTTNPVSALAGRTLYLGSSAYVYFHGFGEEYAKRSENLHRAYSASYAEMKKFCDKNNISYIYVGVNELNEYEINTEMLSEFDKVYSKGGNSLYKVK